jgi:hypothetical protein
LEDIIPVFSLKIHLHKKVSVSVSSFFFEMHIVKYIRSYNIIGNVEIFTNMMDVLQIVSTRTIPFFLFRPALHKETLHFNTLLQNKNNRLS